MIQLVIRVIPRASKPGIAGVRDGALLVRLQSPPVEGAANDELIALIAKAFGIAKRDVTIISGEHAKLKRVAISTDQSGINSVLRTLGINPHDLKATS